MFLFCSSMHGRSAHISFVCSQAVPRAVLPGHTSMVNLLKFHPHQRLLVSASDDGTCRSWDLRRIDLVSKDQRIHIQDGSVSGCDGCYGADACDHSNMDAWGSWRDIFSYSGFHCALVIKWAAQLALKAAHTNQHIHFPVRDTIPNDMHHTGVHGAVLCVLSPSPRHYGTAAHVC